MKKLLLFTFIVSLLLSVQTRATEPNSVLAEWKLTKAVLLETHWTAHLSQTQNRTTILFVSNAFRGLGGTWRFINYFLIIEDCGGGRVARVRVGPNNRFGDGVTCAGEAMNEKLLPSLLKLAQPMPEQAIKLTCNTSTPLPECTTRPE
jgi:hypothetical protein